MISLLSPFLSSLRGSCYDYGNPKGAIALGAAAVCHELCFFISNNKSPPQLHRAFSMYTTGTRIEPGNFSHENVGGVVAVFCTNSERLTDRRWGQILASYGGDVKGKQKMVVDDLFTEQDFRALYVPSSPY
jgi:hypothetical protein